MLRAGKPAAVVVTEVFVNLAQTAARARGVDPIPMLVLPHPMEGRAPAEIDRIAEERFAAAMRLIVDDGEPD
ncbi:hypothetical protein KF840_02850 [bacterium]|nr:hypothetical protein [bacterium]